jgi:probable F420-dependent oxidoreductase
MRIDGLLAADLASVPGRARELEELGYDGVMSFETDHDPFLPLALAAEHTQRVELITGVAIALARSPMTVAYTAYDIQVLSGGRLLLGLGSQTRPHIERRFGMTWSAPAARMREYIVALRAIWASWADGERLDFRGDFYRHTLMTPFFAPKPSPSGPPRVFLGALGDRMVEVAGEVADGLLLHPMTTERFLRERTLPAIKRGLARAERSDEAFQVGVTPFVVTGEDEAAMEEARRGVRQQLAFYSSTPAYRAVLELHGWGDLQGELNDLTRQGRWNEMGALITPEMLDAFAVQAPLPEVADALSHRFAGIADRIGLNAPRGVGAERWAEMLGRLRTGTPR